MESSEFIFAGAMKTIIGLLIIVGAVVLQIFLSRSQRKWPGLILPVLTFIYSLIGVLSIASFKAAIDFSRPTSKCITILGNSTCNNGAASYEYSNRYTPCHIFCCKGKKKEKQRNR